VLRTLLKEPHDHPHLINLLATFEQGQQHYLILPWAESDLDNCWKDFWRSKSPQRDGRLSVWLVQQCKGIVEALSRIHRYPTTSETTISYHKSVGASVTESARESSQYNSTAEPRNPLTLFGRHGDIRPKNILWFHDPAAAQDLGTLKLSDFGSARFGDKTTMSEKNQESRAISLTYRSPECQLPGGEPSIQCDVWALGCVFLEFVCWYHARYDGLKDFSAQRSFGYDSDSYFTIVKVDKIEKQPQLYAKVKEPVVKVSPSTTLGTS
jgi:serine/threonine protein kinase